MTRRPPGVPRVFEALLGIALPPEEQGAALGDLAEEFRRIHAESGPGAARRWYRRQVLSSLRTTVERRWWRHRRGFSGPAEAFSEQGGGRMEGMGRDVRYAVRSLFGQPSYLVIAVLTLGAGIGGTAALWSVIHDTLLKPLPYADDGQLVVLWDQYSWRAPELLHMRDRWDGFDGASGYTTASVTFRLPDGPTSQFNSTLASAELFDVLGTRPLLGRGFEPGDDAPGAAPVVVLGHEVWQNDLGSDPNVLGRIVVIDGEPRTVVGVMPRGFFFPERGYSVFLPGPIDPENSSGRWSVVARLPEGRAIADMAPVLDHVTTELGANFEYPSRQWDRTEGAELFPLRDEIVGDVRTALWLTLGAVGLILAMAVANVSALALSRTRARRQELAIRIALGAGRGRIGRQLLVESTVVGLLAGIVGVAFAAGAFQGIVGALPLTRELSMGLGVDWRIFGAAFGLALLVSLAVGSAPILNFLRAGPRGGLSSSRRVVTSGGVLERGLVVFEMALAVILITGAGLMLRSVDALYDVDPGFEPEGLLKVTVTMGQLDFPDAERGMALEALGDRLEAVPGVQSAAAVQVPPLWGAGWNFGLAIEGREPINRSTLYRFVTEGYFANAGVDVIEGREFEATDEPGSTVVTVVNQAFVREYFADEEVLGARIDPGLGSGWATVVGVVEDEALTGLREPVGPARYVLGRQFSWVPENHTFLIRTSLDPVETLAGPVRAAVREFDPRVAVSDLESMDAAFERALGRTGQMVHLLTALGLLGLVLGAVGVYGVLNHFVTRRTREWGVRLALGQSPARVIRHIMGGAGRLVGFGVALGLIGAWFGSRALSAVLFGIAPTDATSFAGGAIVLTLVGLLAAALPARRAATVDPVISLHSEG